MAPAIGLVLLLLCLLVQGGPSPTRKTAVGGPALGKFEKWLDEIGAIRHVSFSRFPGMGIGVLAVESLEDGDTVLQVPLSHVICMETITERLPPPLRTALAALPSEDDRLASFLVYERAKGSASDWAPYFDVLPSTVPVAYMAPRKAARQLQEPYILEAVLREKKKTIQAYNRAVPTLRALFGLTSADVVGGGGNARDSTGLPQGPVEGSLNLTAADSAFCRRWSLRLAADPAAATRTLFGVSAGAASSSSSAAAAAAARAAAAPAPWLEDALFSVCMGTGVPPLSEGKKGSVVSSSGGARPRRRGSPAAGTALGPLSVTVADKLDMHRGDRLGLGGFGHTHVSLQSFVWARAIVGSRALTIRGRRYLVPGADMFNHLPAPDAYERNHEGGERFLRYHGIDDVGGERFFTVRADRSTSPGSQLYEDYGDEDNAVYALHHGFVADPNPFDCVRLQIPLPHEKAPGLPRTLLLRHRPKGAPPFTPLSALSAPAAEALTTRLSTLGSGGANASAHAARVAAVAARLPAALANMSLPELRDLAPEAQDAALAAVALAAGLRPVEWDMIRTQAGHLELALLDSSPTWPASVARHNPNYRGPGGEELRAAHGLRSQMLANALDDLDFDTGPVWSSRRQAWAAAAEVDFEHVFAACVPAPPPPACPSSYEELAPPPQLPVTTDTEGALATLTPAERPPPPSMPLDPAPPLMHRWLSIAFASDDEMVTCGRGPEHLSDDELAWCRGLLVRTDPFIRRARMAAVVQETLKSFGTSEALRGAAGSGAHGKGEDEWTSLEHDERLLAAALARITGQNASAAGSASGTGSEVQPSSSSALALPAATVLRADGALSPLTSTAASRRAEATSTDDNAAAGEEGAEELDEFELLGLHYRVLRKRLLTQLLHYYTQTGAYACHHREYHDARVRIAQARRGLESLEAALLASPQREDGKEEGDGSTKEEGEASQPPVAAASSSPSPSPISSPSAKPLSSFPSLAELPALVDAFNAWFSAAAGPSAVVAVKAVTLPGLRLGVVTTRPLEAEEPYLSIPVNLTLSSETAAKDPLLAPVFVELRRKMGTPRGDPFHELLLHLLYERFVKGPTSRWWPYLALLPSLRDISAPGTAWVEGDVLLLDGSPMRRDILNYRADVARRYAGVKKHVLEPYADIFPPGVFTFEAYAWGVAILDSRAIWWNEVRHLVPMLDLVNHGQGPDPRRVHSTVLDEGGRAAVTRSDRPYPTPGVQLFENYGQPNHQLLLHHGFTTLPNAADCARLDLVVPLERLPRNHPAYLRRAAAAGVDPAEAGAPPPPLPRRVSEWMSKDTGAFHACVAGEVSPGTPLHYGTLQALQFLSALHGVDRAGARGMLAAAAAQALRSRYATTLGQDALLLVRDAAARVALGRLEPEAADGDAWVTTAVARLEKNATEAAEGEEKRAQAVAPPALSWRTYSSQLATMSHFERVGWLLGSEELAVRRYLVVEKAILTDVASA